MQLCCLKCLFFPLGLIKEYKRNNVKTPVETDKLKFCTYKCISCVLIVFYQSIFFLNSVSIKINAFEKPSLCNWM